LTKGNEGNEDFFSKHQQSGIFVSFVIFCLGSSAVRRLGLKQRATEQCEIGVFFQDRSGERARRFLSIEQR
jgi:hypothetical protein